LENNANFISIIVYNVEIDFDKDNRLNDFIEIRKNKLAYIGKSDDTIFSIVLFDIYNDFKNMKVRLFQFDLEEHKIETEFESFLYNDYLAISSTVSNKNTFSGSQYSIFVLFGYVNGTDDTIDINKYFNKEITNQNNLVSVLTENAIIDNNIFGYEILNDQIKLVHIPDHLIFCNNDNNIRLENGDILQRNYNLEINSGLSDDNYLEYQIMIIEADYDAFNNHSNDIKNYTKEGVEFIDEKDYYNRTSLYGRTNKLTLSYNTTTQNNDIEEEYSENQIINESFNYNEEAYNHMLEQLKQYDPEKNKSIYYNTEDMNFEISTKENEKKELIGKSIRDNLTIIDIDKCEDVLRAHYEINDNISLIFLKTENINSNPSEKNVQYEIYEALNKTRLNLSLCSEVDINLYFPIELNHETQKLYEDLNKQGYDLFNINDKFYQDICTPYKSQNGTDILLSDRINDIYSKNNNLTTCQQNCEYSNYLPETKLLKCKCNVNIEPIDYKNQQKFSPKKIYESFYDVLKYSNYKMLKCYKLILNNKTIFSNIGSIIVFAFFAIYFFLSFFFICIGISSLQKNITKLLFDNPKQKIQSSKNLLEDNHNINNQIKPQNKNKNKKNSKKNQLNFFLQKRSIIKQNQVIKK